MVPPIQTPRLTVRPLHPDDRAEFRRVWHLSQDLWQPWSPLPEPGETADDRFDDFLDRAAKGAADGSAVRLVGLLADGRIAGFFNLSNIVRGVSQNGYAGWSVSADVARQGYGTEGVTAMLDVAFAPPPAGLELHRVQADVIPTNRASGRVAEKAGFRAEGLALQRVKIAGRWQDHTMYAKLAHEHEFRHLRPGDGRPS